jgi:hypothetical protein
VISSFLFSCSIVFLVLVRHPISYAVRELMRDVNEQLDSLPDSVDKEKLRKETVFGVFVVHNK